MFKMKNYLLYIAIFLILVCLSFTGNTNEVRWLWEDSPWVPITLMFISLMCIGFYLYKVERINKGER